MKTFNQIVEKCREGITEMFPWDLEEFLEQRDNVLLIDIREPYEYDTMHIQGSVNVPRGILETACEWNYEETEPDLVQARERPVVLVCRSGNRTILSAHMLKDMGYQEVISLKTGLRGWCDYELPFVDIEEKPVDQDTADHYFADKTMPYQRGDMDAIIKLLNGE